MRTLCSFLFSQSILFFFFSVPSDSVKCFIDHGYEIGNENTTCEGDFCVIMREGLTSMDAFVRTCIVGAKMPSTVCSLSYSDQMTCYCNTDFCNIPDMFLSNFTTLPIIECRDIKLKTYIPTACNKCIRRIEYKESPNKLVDPKTYLHEYPGGDNAESASDFVLSFRSFDVERIYRNFFSDACYNTSMHPKEYSVYCRCTQPNCNTPESVALPYPISDPTVTCHTSGLDESHGLANYDEDSEIYVDYKKNRKNQSFFDEGKECRGHFCFIAAVEYSGDILYYKGCISANEQGENRIQLGYSYLNFVEFHICDTDFCNSDIETAVEEARNASLTVRDNGSKFSFNIFLSILVIFSSSIMF